MENAPKEDAPLKDAFIWKIPIIYSCVYIEETPKMSHKEDSTLKRMSQYGKCPYMEECPI